MRGRNDGLQATNMIPFTVIGGFLGAGKTTLLNRVLSDPNARRYLVMVNDFGDLAVDDRLVKDHGGDTLTFANGCVCCTMGDNFLATLMEMLRAPVAFDHVLVETSGVADPRPVADIAVLHPKLSRDLIVVLVDGETIRDRAEDVRLKETVNRQIAAADLIVLNRCDRLPPEDIRGAKSWLRARKPRVPIVETVQADLPLDLLFAGTEVAETGEPQPHAHDHNQHFRAVTIEFNGPVDRDKLATQLKSLSALLRAKGWVETLEGPALVQLSGPEVVWSPAEDAENRLVVIGTVDMAQDNQIAKHLQSAEIGYIEPNSNGSERI